MTMPNPIRPPAPLTAIDNCGHTGPNVPLPLGIRAAIDADTRTIELVEGAVEE
jgi:muramoyltetrapeptide carboxypeptidase LdcA involved in peptidoglycan recycling